MNLQSQLDHFNRVFAGTIIDAQKTLLSDQPGRINATIKSIESSSAFRSIKQAISHSTDALKELQSKLDGLGTFAKMIGGLVLVGAGAMLWKTAGVLAVALIALGIAIALPAIWSLVETQMTKLLKKMPRQQNLCDQGGSGRSPRL